MRKCFVLIGQLPQDQILKQEATLTKLHRELDKLAWPPQPVKRYTLASSENLLILIWKSRKDLTPLMEQFSEVLESGAFNVTNLQLCQLAEAELEKAFPAQVLETIRMLDKAEPELMRVKEKNIQPQTTNYPPSSSYYLS